MVKIFGLALIKFTGAVVLIDCFVVASGTVLVVNSLPPAKRIRAILVFRHLCILFIFNFNQNKFDARLVEATPLVCE